MKISSFSFFIFLGLSQACLYKGGRCILGTPPAPSPQTHSLHLGILSWVTLKKVQAKEDGFIKNIFLFINLKKSLFESCLFHLKSNHAYRVGNSRMMTSANGLSWKIKCKNDFLFRLYLNIFLPRLLPVTQEACAEIFLNKKIQIFNNPEGPRKHEALPV